VQVLIIQLRASVQMFKLILGPRAAFIERLVMNEKVDLGLITNATSSPQLIVEPSGKRTW
jgi:hypothetical protein